MSWQHYLFKPWGNYVCNYRFACSKAAGRWVFGNRRDVKVIHNAIDAQAYAFDGVIRQRLRSELGVEQKFVVGFVGKLHEQKNLFRALDIFKAVKNRREDLDFLLVGEGDQRDELERYAVKNEIADSVRFLDRRDNVNALMMAFDVFLLLSSLSL